MNCLEITDLKLKKGGLCQIYRQYLDKKHADQLFDELTSTMSWSQSDLMMYGKKLKTPRFQCWMGDHNVGAEVYSKTRVDWTPSILSLKSKIQQDVNFEFNYLLLNYYKTGDHYIGYHSDNEVLSSNDLIGSVSLGGQRRFLIREKLTSKAPENYEIVLNAGDLMIMDGLMQKFYKHSIPKTTQKVAPRINLTFRRAKVNRPSTLVTGTSTLVSGTSTLVTGSSTLVSDTSALVSNTSALVSDISALVNNVSTQVNNTSIVATKIPIKKKKNTD